MEALRSPAKNTLFKRYKDKLKFEWWKFLK